MDNGICGSVLYCSVQVEAFMMGRSHVQRSPITGLNKITKSPVSGGQGSYKYSTATDCDDNNEVDIKIKIK
jgi:hypothetical protein